ncbi:MAG TPA: prepilin peptidase [Candidatus Saccharimonadales bacterium]|jgi:leader peptidase (prepilin peptidase)/N-methyltransferase|nr:prepilin peptidase [Candidatus Saccharimonadales bacterium]
MNILTIVALGLLGLCMGSFVNALVWRLKTNRNFVTERSMCVHCHHQLSTLDLIPVVSWLILKGSCRYCGKPISWQYPIVELLVVILFVGSFVFWPTALVAWPQITQFVVWLIFMVMVSALFIYDVRWLTLPDKLTYPLIVLGLVSGIVSLVFVQHIVGWQVILELLYGAASIGGFYGLLYLASKGKWVGLGDAKLGLAMGLALGWELGVFVLVLANVIGTLFVVPALLSKRLNRQSKIPFGPFLIVAFVIAGLWGTTIINWYMNHLLIGM